MFQRRNRTQAAVNAINGKQQGGKAGESTAGTVRSYIKNLRNVKISNAFLTRLVAILFMIFSLHGTGIWLFQSGFLLSRLELDSKNNCSTYGPASGISTIGSSGTPLGIPGNAVGCWHEGRFKRVVFVIIDALRFDFTVYNETLAAAAASASSSRTDDSTGSTPFIPHYINKLPIIHEILQSQPGHGLLFRARADPPTTTLQRLKALTTGTLPTFVDAGNNFGSSAIGEDNMIDQLVAMGKRLYFMGDDTWVGLFPTQMAESHPYPSFNVRDLHTVDNGCIAHLFPALEQNPKDWDFLISHFLGVDHVGHTFGPSTWPMVEKLGQVDGWLRKVFDGMDEDTLVVVVGDHGMDSKGDHGGDSENEVNAGLFVYSKGKKLVDIDDVEHRTVFEDVLAGLDEVEVETRGPYVSSGGFRTLPQIDLVPTLSLLMGIPVPFGNLGTVVPDLFFVKEKVAGTDAFRDPLHNLLEATRLNAMQIKRYLTEYSQQRTAADFGLAVLTALFDEAEKTYEKFLGKLQGVARPLTSEENAIAKSAHLGYVRFMRQSLVAARKIWARFDVPLIIMGVLVLALSFICCVVTLIVVWRRDGVLSMASGLGFVAGGIVGAVLAVTTGFVDALVRLLPFDGDSVMGAHHEAAFGAAVMACIGYLMVSVRDLWKGGVKSKYATLPQTTPTTSNTTTRKKQSSSVLPSWISVWIPSADGILGATLLILQTMTPASDSFTIHEESVSLYLLQAFGLYSLAKSFAAKTNESRGNLLLYTISFLVLGRLSLTSTICRDEKINVCKPTYNVRPNSSVAAPHAVLLLIAMVPIVIMAVRRILINTHSYYATGNFVAGLCVPAGLIISSLHWTLDTLEGHGLFRDGILEPMKFVKVWIAKVGFLAASCVCLYVWGTEPSCMGMREDKGFSDEQIQQQQAHVNGPLRGRRFIILGLENAMGSCYLVFIVIAYMVLVMFQKPMGGVMLGLALLQLLCLFEIFAEWRDGAFVGNGDGGGGVGAGSDESKRSAVARAVLASKGDSDSSSLGKKDSVGGGGGDDEDSYDCGAGTMLLFIVVLVIMGHRYYFATGHQTTLSSIQWDMSFVGLDEVNWYVSPIMMALNTYGGHLLAALSAPMLGLWRRAIVKGTENRMVKELTASVGMMVMCWSLGGLSATLFAGHFRRHLMVWGVFAPKFLFQDAGMLIVEVCVMVFGMAAVALPWFKYREFMDALEAKRVT
ncbi:mannose-ethanolamine phosphotransferase gpi13 [Blyttiomyces sp. JEL0837]|nr:mannose-ethanolamine phosphotransferase gpi13 [Blyttiomyces sp. JEL0837]